MKKVLFVSAIMCMTMAAFVACNKNNAGNADEGGEGGGAQGGGSGVCACYALGQYLGDYDLEGAASCATLASLVNDQLGGMYTVTCNAK